MSNASLAEDLFAQLQGAPLQQVSQQLGIGQMQAASAVSAATCRAAASTTLPSGAASARVAECRLPDP